MLDDVLVVAAVVLAGLWWAAYGAGVLLGRFVERIRTPRS